MFSKLKKNFFNVTLLFSTIGLFIALKLLNVGFSTILLILMGGVIGLTVYLVGFFINKSKKEGNE